MDLYALTELRYMQGNLLEGERSIRNNADSLSTIDFKSNYKIIYELEMTSKVIGSNHNHDNV